MVQATQSDVSTLCGQNMLLWMQYLELVTFNKIITHHLATEHHLQRVYTHTDCFTHELLGRIAVHSILCGLLLHM